MSVFLLSKIDPFLILSSIHQAIIGANENILQNVLEAGQDPRDNFDGNITSFHLAMLWDIEPLSSPTHRSRFISESLESEPTVESPEYYSLSVPTQASPIWTA
jgi:hypothetical protein